VHGGAPDQMRSLSVDSIPISLTASRQRETERDGEGDAENVLGRSRGDAGDGVKALNAMYERMIATGGYCREAYNRFGLLSVLLITLLRTAIERNEPLRFSA
jgi:hypothetical protein